MHSDEMFRDGEGRRVLMDGGQPATCAANRGATAPMRLRISQSSSTTTLRLV